MQHAKGTIEMERIGLVAGAGELPLIFAREARRRGVKVIGFAIKEMASPSFDKECDKVHRLSIGQVKKFAFLLIFERIKKIAMLGKVEKSIIYDSNVKMDERAQKVLDRATAKSDYNILDKITAELNKIGVELINGIDYLQELFPSRGVLTKRQPSEKETEDISCGFKVAKEIARMDIGQTVVVKDGSVVSVEAMEGTDRAIERARGLCGEGFSVIKVSRPDQDMKWDVPVIGPETIKIVAKHSGKALAMESDRMFLVEKETCVRLCDENDITLVVL